MSAPRPAQQFPATGNVLRVRGFKAEVVVLRCTVQQQLREQYDSQLASYNRDCLALGRSVGYKTAEDQMWDAYQACVKSREALQRHETAHRCGELSTPRMSPEMSQTL